MEQEIVISLQKKQREALEASEYTPVLFYGGAKGGGKSYLVRAREIYRRMKYPNTKGLILRKTYPELLSNHIRKFYTEYPHTIPWMRRGENAIYYPNGSLTEFSHLASANDVYNYQGREYEDISIDEITQHTEEVFKILRSSNRTTNPNCKPRMLLTGNPGGIGHQWVKRMFIDRDFLENEHPDEYGFVQAKVHDNNALMEADPDYIKRLQDLPPDMVKAYLDGDWNIFSGQFFSEWRSTIHVIKPFIPESDNLFVGGVDWGRAAPFSFHISMLEEVKFEEVKFYRMTTFLEVYGTEKNPRDWADIIKNELNKFRLKISDIAWIRGDPSMFVKGNDMSISISDQFKREDIFIKPASNDRIGGWVNMHNWLSLAPDGTPYWRVTENCKDLIRTLPLMIYDENRIEDLDTTLEDHAVDGMRYCMKHVKWVDARVGGIKKTKPLSPQFFTAKMDQGQQVSIDLNKFEEAYAGKTARRSY